MAGNITVKFYTKTEDLIFSGNSAYIAENIIIECCKYLNIRPASRHLFGLWCPTNLIWFPLCKEFKLFRGNSWNLYLRVRFKTADIKTLRGKTDDEMLNYYFHQVHGDFLEGRIPELCQCHGQMWESALGLVATDMIREMLEKKMTPETMKFNSRNFIPRVLKKNPLWDSLLCEPLQKAVNRGWKNCRQNPDFVKELYLQQLTQLVPDYGSEIYSVLIDESGKVYEVDLVVDPFHVTYPGIRMRLKKSKDNWTHISEIADLCYISMRNDETVEISRRNGVPQYVQFRTKAQMHSFVSALDGYYRLSEKWIFNLCKDLPTPSLVNLRATKCHGPVGFEFSYKKLKEKSNEEVGCYILRENDYCFDEYFIDVWTNRSADHGDNITTYKITKHDDKYNLDGTEDPCDTIPLLIAHHVKKNMLNFLRCIPPNEYDRSPLLLCRMNNPDKDVLKSRGDCNCAAQCIPHDAVDFPKDAPPKNGKHTCVAQGYLRRSCTDSKAVAVKMLRKETKINHLKEFLSQCDKILYLQHDAIISTVGMIITDPTALVMEWLPLGSLDVYLQSVGNMLQEVDLVESAYHIARALWFLDEHQVTHGNIRCRNILVASHTDSCFFVKLADPGLISYTDSDVHWIPPECYNDFSRASKSNLADVYAYGTTLWEIFSNGSKPTPTERVKEWYLKGNTLTFPSNFCKEMGRLIEECWLHDQDNRKRPQTIVRDVNQLLYEVYNSRRSHAYAKVDPTTLPEPEQSPTNPPLPQRRPPKKDAALNSLLKMFKWPGNLKSFNYNSLSQSRSTLNASSGNSMSSFLTDDRDSCIAAVNSNSLISINESEPDQCDNQNNLRDLWIINEESLILNEKIGEGFYGEVSKGALIQPDSTQVVAVKRIKTNNQSPLCVNELKREMDIMKTLQHKNIVKIIGLVEDPETMLVMEYVDNGSLLNHLQSFKNRHETLSYSELFRFALGVAQGMEYLETQNIVHRDLAARNILVSSCDTVKISDFGLAQVIKDHYYRMKTERNLPVRWYAIEAIVAQKFSHKSDVWSYGITLWEIFSYGENPQIPNVADNLLHEALQEGKRLGKPPDCPGMLYFLMKRCWDENSHARPSFCEIILNLNDLKSELCP